MNPEEFDNKLKKSFERENLPPKEELWQNISSQLDQKSKFNFWWVFTVSAILIGIIIIGQQLSGNFKKGTTISNNEQKTLNTPNESNPASKEQQVSTSQNDESSKETENSASNEQSATDDDNSIKSPKETAPSTTQSRTPWQSNKASKASPKLSANDNSSFAKTSTPLETNIPNSSLTTLVKSSENINSLGKAMASSEDFFHINFLRLKNFQAKPNRFTLSFFNPIETLASNKKFKTNKKTNPKDFYEKWFLAFGIGPQFNINTVNVPNELESYVHKDLWKNKDNTTHNGIGFNTFALLNYKFGRNFIFETGLDYRLRTEDIKLDVTSIDIAARNNANQIIQYANVKLLYIVGKDTTFYDAIASFNLAVKNKYHVITIPFNFKKEIAVSDQSYLSFGLGGGLSYISSNTSKHIDLVNEIVKTENKKSAFNTSLNTQIAFYTNFNDVGQIGIYSGFTMFNNPWQINQKQYSISMKDIQFGITYRKPLQW
jgi:cytoskeletal protein RodZ